MEGTVDTSNSGFILNSTPENSPRPLFSCHNSCSDSSSTPQSTSDEINICRKRRGKCSKPDGHPGAHDNKGTLKNPFYIYSPIIKQNQSRSLDKEISAKTQKLDELNESYERLIYLIERGAVPADVKTPTTFETITNRKICDPPYLKCKVRCSNLRPRIEEHFRRDLTTVFGKTNLPNLAHYLVFPGHFALRMRTYRIITIIQIL